MLTNTVSVIATATNRVIHTIRVGRVPGGVAVTPAPKLPARDKASRMNRAHKPKLYVTTLDSNSLKVIDTARNKVTATIPVGSSPFEVAVTPDGAKVYVANENSNNLSVIDTAADKKIDTIPVGNAPRGVAVTPDGTKVYVANENANTVTVIATATDNVIDTIPVGGAPIGLAVTPKGGAVYVTNAQSGTVSVIATLTNKVIHTIRGRWQRGHTPRGRRDVGYPSAWIIGAVCRCATPTSHGGSPGSTPRR